jgi:hypothetical protein
MKKGTPLPRSRTKRPAKVQLPPAEPEDVTMIKARKLPMFGPGIVITVPINLLMAYMELYHLEPQGMNANGTLLVKRVVPTSKKASA